MPAGPGRPAAPPAPPLAVRLEVPSAVGVRVAERVAFPPLAPAPALPAWGAEEVAAPLPPLPPVPPLIVIVLAGSEEEMGMVRSWPGVALVPLPASVVAFVPLVPGAPGLGEGGGVDWGEEGE